MSDLLAARLTMAISLGFHIVLAAIGMVMPFLMAIAHRTWLRTGDEHAYRLTRAWMRGVAIFFATGAVSGTALSFELGILWPTFMRHAGPIFGMPFSLEGAAFFVEAHRVGNLHVRMEANSRKSSLVDGRDRRFGGCCKRDFGDLC